MSMDNMVLCNCLSAKNEHSYRKRHSFEKKKKKISSVYMDGMLAHIFHCLSELVDIVICNRNSNVLSEICMHKQVRVFRVCAAENSP